MNSERWQKVKVLFDEAISLDPEQRAQFLSEACQGDHQLRCEIENLLASFAEADSFMEKPAAHDVASLIIERKPKPESGERITHYEIISQIGEGGMGEVYLAKDTHLNRKVALKLLATHITEDKNRARRFRQEAFATSALNHPNIVTIYEIGEWRGRDFIVTEFIEGMTLRSFLKRKKPPIGETLDIALQIAGALAAAHGAGIVHRDIKPENIMIRPDSLVKILDFGIAKYLPSESGRRRALVETRVGEVIGTAAYMSPEQARGLEVDARTDIWSLSVILYELLARKLPFTGATQSDRIAAILERDPPPLKNARFKIPPELERIVNRGLAKNKEERYQKMEELIEDLHKIRDRSATKRRPAFILPSSGSPQKFSWHYWVFALIILLLAGGGTWLYLRQANFELTALFRKPSSLSLQTMKINRLGDTSQAIDVAISPDGEFVVFIKEENGKQSLWLKQVSASSSVQIAAPVEDFLYGSPAFSPDGSHIYYLKVRPRSARATLYQIPKLGGSEKKLVGDISFQDSGSNFSLSPDGKRVAFIRLDEGFNRSLVTTDLDGSNERSLIARKLPEFLTGAAWSPDGEKIVTFSGKFGGKGGSGGEKGLTSVNVADASEESLSEKPWVRIEGMSWLGDASGLILSAAEKPELVQLWHISNPDGAVSRITNDLSDYAAPSLTAEFSTIAVVQINQNSNIWTVSSNQKEIKEKQLTFGNGGKDGSHGLSLTPEGGIVYTSQASGNSEIYFVDADGLLPKQLTANAGINTFPSVSPDGKYVVFNSSRSGETGIWRTDIDGTNPLQLTTGSLPSFSPDGKWVYFYRTGVLWKVSIDGGEPAKIKIPEKDLATAPVVSPDNSMIACNYLRSEPNAQFRIGVVPVEGGKPLKIFDTLTYAVKTLRWQTDSRAVTFIETRNGVSNILSHSLDDEKATPVTNFKSGIIWDFDWSDDGKSLAIARGNLIKDVVLISSFK